MGFEIKDFKEWYDAVYIGDGEKFDHIPLATEKNYSDYISGYTLAHGAWVESAKRARADFNYYQELLKQSGFEDITDLRTKYHEHQRDKS
jgi:hypothetical protein